MKNEKQEILYTLITELEKIGCFEIKTDNSERRKIAKLLIKTIKDGDEYELLDKMSDRWL